MLRATRTRLAAIVAIAVAAGALSISPTTAAPPPAATAASPSDLAGLRVLVTNDDSARGQDTTYGTDGKGLYELRQALCAAGADVLVVAPWRQQSGASAQITPPGFTPVPFTVQRVNPPAAYGDDCEGQPADGAVFGVCVADAACTSSTPSASPSDAVNVALSRFAATYWPDGPDLLLSGTNFGQNVGAMVNHSGTVGAAITAREHGVPAVALSAEVPHDAAGAMRVPFTATAELAVRVVRALVTRDLLEPGLVLNVNHPYIGSGERLGRPVAAVVGTSLDPGFDFTGTATRAGGTYRLLPGRATDETRGGADTTALGRNDIPITRLDGDWTAIGSRGELQRLLQALR